jgi:AcrR family transcriptional regulator
VGAVDDSATKDQAGRRIRKRRQTRSLLTRSALDLFAERGFDAVTVTDIANRADVDPSTFFRHFRSKESVLFTDMDTYVSRIRHLVRQRPSDEPVLDMLHAVTRAQFAADRFDNELEYLRAKLTQSSPGLRAQNVIRRERVASELAELLGELLCVDPREDARPYLSATMWLAALDWHRRRNTLSHYRPGNVPESIDDLVATIQSAIPQVIPGTGPTPS